MAKVRNKIKGRNQKCVRYDNKRGDNFKVYASFVSKIIMLFFHCFIKCYESKARGNRESDGLKKFPDIQGVMKKFLPLISLPADFEERSATDKSSALAKVASDQAKEAAGMYERNQASVPLNGGSGNQLENPEGRPPPFSDMLFNNLGRPDVVTSLELVPRLTGRERANEGDVYPPVYNVAEGGENVRSPISQMIYEFDEFDKEQLQLFGLVDEGQQHDHDVLAQEENSMLPSPLGSQLEGFDGEIIGASNPSKIGELPISIQQCLDEFDAEQGEVNEGFPSIDTFPA